MATLKHLSIVPVLLILIQLSAAEDVLFRQCQAISEEQNIPRNCSINRVRIAPCPEAAHNRPCSIRRRQQASISFDYTPEKAPTALQSQAYWASEMDLPFAGMDNDACAYTTCQDTAGQEQTYTYNLAIPDKARPRQYDVKWKLWNDDLECCFIVTFVVPSKRN